MALTILTSSGFKSFTEMNRPEFKQDVNELYTFFANLLADEEPYGIEWHIHNVEVAIDHLNKFIETHPKTLQQ